MVVKRSLLKYTKRKLLFKRVHIIIAALGGGFLVMHGDFFIGAPISNTGVALGYVATGVALFVWFSGFAFLERLSDSLLYHGSLSLAAVSLMMIHAVSIGFSFQAVTSEIILAVTASILLVTASRHIAKILTK